MLLLPSQYVKQLVFLQVSLDFINCFSHQSSLKIKGCFSSREYLRENLQQNIQSHHFHQTSHQSLQSHNCMSLFLLENIRKKILLHLKKKFKLIKNMYFHLAVQKCNHFIILKRTAVQNVFIDAKTSYHPQNSYSCFLHLRIQYSHLKLNSSVFLTLTLTALCYWFQILGDKMLNF